MGRDRNKKTDTRIRAPILVTHLYPLSAIVIPLVTARRCPARASTRIQEKSLGRKFALDHFLCRPVHPRRATGQCRPARLHPQRSNQRGAGIPTLARGCRIHRPLRQPDGRRRGGRMTPDQWKAFGIRDDEMVEDRLNPLLLFPSYYIQLATYRPASLPSGGGRPSAVSHRPPSIHETIPSVNTGNP